MKRNIEYIVVHCSATTPSMDIGAHEIRRWHTEERGWSDIGYHLVCRRDGTVEAGRPIERPGAHVKGYNHSSIGVCWVGGVSESGQAEDNRTADQSLALFQEIERLRELYPEAKVLGHRDFPGVTKACPCFDVKDWLQLCDTRKREVPPKKEEERTDPQNTTFRFLLWTILKKWIRSRFSQRQLAE